MNHRILIGYQLLIGLSDAITGALLIAAPRFTLGMMRLHAPDNTLVYLSFIGAFVLSVGLSCLYGAYLVIRHGNPYRWEVVWLLTAIVRASVAIFVITQIIEHTLEVGWLTVAITDGACVLIQTIGLRKGWLTHVAQ
jgi:hypothetical protein